MGITGEQLANELRAQYPDKASAIQAAADYRKVVAKCEQSPAFHDMVIKEYEMPNVCKHMTMLARALEILY